MNKATLIKKVKEWDEKYPIRREAAAALGISTGEMHQFIVGAIEPPRKMLDAMGLERVVNYRKVK